MSKPSGPVVTTGQRIFSIIISAIWFWIEGDVIAGLIHKRSVMGDTGGVFGLVVVALFLALFPTFYLWRVAFGKSGEE